MCCKANPRVLTLLFDFFATKKNDTNKKQPPAYKTCGFLVKASLWEIRSMICEVPTRLKGVWQLVIGELMTKILDISMTATTFRLLFWSNLSGTLQ